MSSNVENTSNAHEVETETLSDEWKIPITRDSTVWRATCTAGANLYHLPNADGSEPLCGRHEDMDRWSKKEVHVLTPHFTQCTECSRIYREQGVETEATVLADREDLSTADIPPWRIKRKLVEAFIHDGLLPPEMAENWGCSSTTVRNWLRRYDVYELAELREVSADD